MAGKATADAPDEKLAWLIELGAMVLTCFACLAAYPVAVPVIVPLWILRTCVYYARTGRYPDVYPDPNSRVQLSLCFAFCLLTGVMSIHVCELWFGWDPLALPMVNGELVSVDSWSFIHVLTFAFLGYLYPDQILLMTVFGVLWEAVEFALSSDHHFWGERGVNTLWDIFFNTFGYRLGETLFILYGPMDQLENLASYKSVAGQTARQDGSAGARAKSE